jgi:N-acetylglucosamine kinase-like BadF-type ATPase
VSEPTTTRTQPAATRHALGLDAGGTHTRWAVADAGGVVTAQGLAPPLSGLQLGSVDGRTAAEATLQAVRDTAGPVHALVAGLTGFDASQAPVLAAMAASVLGMSPKAVRAMNDIELTCHAAGDAYVVYAGTGSIAAYIDATGALQRTGGRGAIIDDAGSGHWLARQALCHVWRAEDVAPGAWQQSALAQRLFARIGGTGWAATRAWVYGASRGELGTLALAVAEAAEQDPVALALLQQAGAEIARLGLALAHRHGPRPMVMAGRVFALHPAVQAGLRAALPPGTELRTLPQPAHHAAAQMAARSMAPDA